MNYVDTFIAIADDCPVREGTVPPNRSNRKSIAQIQYELLAGNPYRYTQEDIQFETFIRHKGTPSEQRRSENARREKFFAKPQACLRSSPLPKKYGWGLHFDQHGRVALHPIESTEYRQLSRGAALKVLKALRSSRAS